MLTWKYLYIFCQSSSFGEQTNCDKPNCKMVVASTRIQFQNILQIGQIHFVLNQLSWMNHGELVMRVEDQLLNAILFIVGIDWYGPIVEYLKKGYFEHDIPKE